MCIRKKQRERERDMLGNVVKERGGRGREEGFLLPFII